MANRGMEISRGWREAAIFSGMDGEGFVEEAAI